ncbi:hypothetical protein [Polyangium aurulentum]|uniref:hypothetical protein n=1 Tax=Polyangium aurulentum TaxID=2567896 RepID=UPI0010AE5924|nr:hypothetical protein [Polyangium aurulentum]UQA56529.1 hypothetical protein E8A73_035235 [Polyangium aurulentum]
MTTPGEDEAPRAQEAAADEPPGGAPAPVASSSRRRFLTLILLAGGVGAAVSILPHWPKERAIDFRIEEDAGSVVGLDVTWSRAGSTDEPVLGSSFRFAPGEAPKIIHTTVHLPDGSYELDITLERSDRSASIQRRLTLEDAEQITVPLR